MESGDFDHAAATLQAAIERLMAARAAVAAAEAHRGRAVAAAERRLRKTTGGLGAAQLARAADRRRINTTAEAVMVARAVRARATVQIEADARRAVEAREDERVREAQAELALAEHSLNRLGAIGQHILRVTVPASTRDAR